MTLSTWTPLTLVAFILGYAVIAVALVVAPMVMLLLREAWQARRERREPTYVLLLPYPVYLLRYRRWFRLLLVPPVLLAAAWIWTRVS